MSPSLKLLFVFVCFAALLGFASANARAAGQDLAITWENGNVALTYTTEPGTSSEIYASSNLLEWGLANLLSEAVTENPDGTRSIKATVIGVGPSMFFRLRMAPAQPLTVAWDAAVDSSVAGYIIRLRRRGEAAMRRIDAGNSTTATLVIPQDGGLYSFDVISYTAEGLESAPSNAIAIHSHISGGG